MQIVNISIKFRTVARRAELVEYEVVIYEGQTPFEPVHTTLGWKEVHATIASLMEVSPNEDAHDEAAAIEMSETMERFVKVTKWGELRQRILNNHGDDIVHLNIVADDERVFSLPWELLRLSKTQTVGGSTNVLVRCSTGAREQPDVTQGRVPPQILLVCADVKPSWVNEHRRAIHRAARAAGFDPQECLQVLDNASLESITRTLAGAERPFDVLHVLCHGAESHPVGDQLRLLDEDREVVSVGAGRFADSIHRFVHQLKLIVLSVCSAGDGAREPGGSMALTLHDRNFQAVIAPRYLLSASDSEIFADGLYRALLVERLSLERAFLAAKSLPGGSIMQYYARVENGDSTPLFPEPKPEPEPEPAPEPESVPEPKPAPAPVLVPEPVRDRDPPNRAWIVVIVATILLAAFTLFLIMRGGCHPIVSGGSESSASGSESESGATSGGATTQDEPPPPKQGWVAQISTDKTLARAEWELKKAVNANYKAFIYKKDGTYKLALGPYSTKKAAIDAKSEYGEPGFIWSLETWCPQQTVEDSLVICKANDAK